MTVYNFKLIRSIKYSLVIAVLLTGLVLCYFIFANQNDKLAIFIVNKTAVMVVMNIELDPKKVINEVNSVLD